MSKYEKLHQECESDIRNGNAQNVARRLAHLNTARVPREWRRPLANVCWRAGLIPTGLRLLMRTIRPTERGSKDASDATSEELAEYAVLLTRSGAVNEAIDTLKKVDTTKVPSAHLYRAFAHFKHWDFPTAVPSLVAYLQSDLQPYARCVGSLNLAYATIRSGHLREADTILRKLYGEVIANNFTLLKFNTLELMARLHIERKALAEARWTLDEAKTLVPEGPSKNRELVDKWEAVLNALIEKKTDGLLHYRKDALDSREWELVREVDRYLLLIGMERDDFEQDRFEHLLFGTPYPAFRARLIEELGRRPEHETYVLGEASAPRLDVVNASLQGQAIDFGELDAGRKPHHVIETLLRDFYRPLTLGELFVGLFPDQHFDIFSSPNRVHQILHRTRKEIEKAALPIKIQEERGAYSLVTTGPLAFVMPLERKPVDGYHQLFEKIRSAFPGATEFRPREVREKLNIPRTTFHRFTTWATEQGLLEKKGSYRTAIYKLPASKPSARNPMAKAAA